MNIVLLLVASVLLLEFIGWGVYRLFVLRTNATPTGSILVFGYALTIVLFFPLYFIVGDSHLAVYFILLLALIINIFVFIRAWRPNVSFLSNLISLKKHGVACLLFIGVIAIAAIPYINSGAGNYWHTGNEDIFDGINGRNAYLKNELLNNSSEIDVSTRVGGTLGTSLNEKMGVSPKLDAQFFRDRYVHDLGRLQYSSLATFSALLNLPKGIDVFIIQALLNLGFFALGVYAFVRHVFLQEKYIALFSAIFSTLGNFYLTTYLNGHEGSLMYNTAVPFILYFSVVALRDRVKMGRWLIIPSVMLAMVLLAYPFPLPYVLAPVVAFALLTWWVAKKDSYSINNVLADRRFQIAVAILFVLGFAIVYLIAEPIRFRALAQFRSWGTALNHIGFLQFWGLWPSGIAFMETTLGWLDPQPILKIVSLITATALSLLALFGFYRLMKQGVTFVVVWVPLWVFFFFVMRFAVYDSYYVYKFLYINAWIIISAAMVAIGYLLESKNKVYRVAGSVAMIVWLAPNVVNNASAYHGLFHSSVNEYSSSYYKILEVPRSILEKTYITIPQDVHSNLIRQILGDAGIMIKRSKAEAQFILHKKGMKDIYSEKYGETVWESDIFSITKKPDHDLIELATYWQLEGLNTEKPFRWVSDSRIGSVLVDIQQRSQNSNFMYVCGESGPSVEFRQVEIKVFDSNRKLAGTMSLGAYGCHWINISSFKAPFSIEHVETGKVVSYIDNRKLVYRIMHIGFSNINSGDRLPQELPSTEDIFTAGKLTVPRQTINAISLGQNWGAFEKFGGESFRWVNNGAEVRLNDVEAEGTLVMEAELGPSAGHAIKILISTRNGKEMGMCELDGRKFCNVPLKFDTAGNQQLFIKSDGEGQHIDSDPRVLNFRVFSIGWQP